MKKYLRKLIQLLGLLLIGISASAQGFDEVQKIVAFDRGIDDYFGKDVAISGDYAVVGSFSDDFGGSNPNMGSAYIYHREIDGNWTFVQKIYNSDQDDYDRFGWSVAIDGDLIVVGAYREDHNAMDGALLSNSGSAYIFERNDAGVWNQVQKIVASDRMEEDEFGFSVAINNDVIVVGSPHNSVDELGLNYNYHVGAAYIFEKTVDGIWVEIKKILPSNRDDHFGTIYDGEDWNWRFGNCVDIYDETIVVGSPFASKAYVFQKEGDDWSEIQTISYELQGGLDRAGEVAIHGNVIVVGGQTFDYGETYPSEYILNGGVVGIFEKNVDGTWLFVKNIVANDRSSGDHFGSSVDVHGDYIVVGAHSDNEDEFFDDTLENTGAIYVYRKVEDYWIEYGKSDASDRTAEDELGTSVAISENAIFAGAINQDFGAADLAYIENGGAVYVYTNNEDVDCPTVFNIQHETVCEGDFIIIDGEIVDEIGTYYNYYTSIEGCDSILVTFFEFESNFPTYFIGVMCEGNSVVINDHIYTEVGVYIDTLTAIDGCDSVIYVSVYDGYIVTDNSIYYDGNDLIASSLEAVTYQWIKCDPYEILIGEDAGILSSPADGDYALIAYSWDGCADTSGCLHVGEIDETGLEDQLEFGEISIFPNPSNGSFTIHLEQFISPIKLEIINELGQLIFTQNLTQNENYIQLKNTSSGLYLVRLTHENEAIYRKILIE
jgi:hypothetical protein